MESAPKVDLKCPFRTAKQGRRLGHRDLHSHKIKFNIIEQFKSQLNMQYTHTHTQTHTQMKHKNQTKLSGRPTEKNKRWSVFAKTGLGDVQMRRGKTISLRIMISLWLWYIGKPQRKAT
eukprot:COSAG06_NODE_25133_length_644_cov_0.976147_2_plen_118_part_01